MFEVAWDKGAFVYSHASFICSKSFLFLAMFVLKLHVSCGKMRCIHKEETFLCASVCLGQAFRIGFKELAQFRTLTCFFNVPFGIFLCFWKVVMSSAMQGAVPRCAFTFALRIIFVVCSCCSGWHLHKSHENRYDSMKLSFYLPFAWYSNRCLYTFVNFTYRESLDSY